MPDAPSQPEARWWRSPAVTLIASLVLAIASTVYLLVIGKSFGALAIGGANLLALALYLFIREPINAMVRTQSGKDAAFSWIASIGWTIGVVGLFHYDLTLLGVLAVSGILLLYMLASWLVVTGRASDDRPSGP